MNKFSKTSLDRLQTCHPDLQVLMTAVLEEVDISILCGHRARTAQTAAYNKGYSKVQFPNSKHNKTPSLACDIAPWPIDWEDLDRFKALSKIVKRKARALGILVEWGGDFRTFIDMPHWQLVKPDRATDYVQSDNIKYFYHIAPNNLFPDGNVGPKVDTITEALAQRTDVIMKAL